jgi:DNA polymerase-3 subunit epsilon
MRLRRAPEGVAVEFAAASKVRGRTPWRQASWCAIDLELTGLDPSENDIIAIGAVPIEAGRIVLGQSLYTLVRTARRSESAAVLVHKLRVADLADAPPLPEAIDALMAVLAGRVPVFHTSGVEQRFLSPLFSRRRVKLPAAADTEVLGRLWLRGRDGTAPARIPLERLSDQLGQLAETPHHALGDALTTAKAFIALASHLDRAEPQTVRSLVHAEEMVRGPWRLA